MTPKISIIIPAYNVEKYIAECLRSVLSQTFSDWEAIVVDDGATDNTVVEIQQFSDERIQLFRQKNAGLSMARNVGLSHAKGNYVLFLDSDDRLHPQTLQVCYDIVQKHKVEAVTFDGYDFKEQEDKEKILKAGYFDRSGKLKKGKYSGQGFLEKEVFARAVVVSAPLYFIKKEKLKPPPFEEGMLHEDVLFHYKLLPLLSSIYYLPRKLYQRRLRKDSIVHAIPSLKSLESYQRIIASLEEIYATAAVGQKKLYRKIICKNMLQVGKVAKRYLLSKQSERQKGLELVKKIIGQGARQLVGRKFCCFLIGFTYYLFKDLQKQKSS